MVRFSVVVPTVGRESLVDAVDSCDGAFEVLVAPDGREAWNAAKEMLNGRARLLEPLTEERLRERGHPQRNDAMSAATGEWLMFLDDDDVFVPSAIENANGELKDLRPHLFRMRYGKGSPEHGLTLWNEPELTFCNVGTPMFVCLNRQDKLGVWRQAAEPSEGRGGDFDFMVETCGLQGDPVFVNRVIAEIRPKGQTE